MIVIVIIARRKKVHEQVFHSEVGQISTPEEHSLTENVRSMTKTSPQKFYNKLSEFEAKRAQDPDSVHLDQSPAYGTNITTAAVAHDINTETNKAYGYLESPASFTMADDSAHDAVH